ncbi:hypothetical protein BFX12_15445 [Vibrio cholerae]|nr:hypothetical protein XV77_13835 [Vibrio cholerae]KQA59180.1 hypothetical protein XV80_14105 [Vibrio cholerae]KQA70489.1 hypothetical protein XV83_11355 [Vibrio cholerae]OEC24516.1 hypothetical protein BFX12_15445 [Vibrio cholerae]
MGWGLKGVSKDVIETCDTKMPLSKFAQQNGGKFCQKIARLLLMADRAISMRGISQLLAPYCVYQVA